MSIPESSIVKVTLSTSQQATSQEGFGLTCAFGNSTKLPVAERFLIASDMSDVAAVFVPADPEYQAAQTYFSQLGNGGPAAQLMIARMFLTAVAAQLIGAPVSVPLATFTAVNSGSLSLVMDGTVLNLTGIDLHLAANMGAVAATIQTALQVAKAGATVVFSNGEFTINSGTTGVNSTITFASPAPAGTDLAPLMKVRMSDGGSAANGLAAETLADSLANVFALYPNFYQFSLVYGPSDADIQTAAAFALANNLVYGYGSDAPGCSLQSSTTDIAYLLSQATNKRTIGIFDKQGLNPFAIMSALAYAATIDFTGTDTTATLMFKQLPGVTVSNISSTEKTVLDGKHMNYYVNVGSNPMFATGVMADGSWFDQIQGLDWLAAACQNAVFAGLYANRKLAQTDKGVATLIHLLQSPLDQGVKNGLLAPGVWNGASIGQIKTGDTLSKGYYIFADSVNNQAQNIRDTRVAPPIMIIAKGAGAIQGVDLIITFEQ